MNKHLVAFISVFTLGLVLSVYYVMIPRGGPSQPVGGGVSSGVVSNGHELYFETLEMNREQEHKAVVARYQDIMVSKDATNEEKRQALTAIEAENSLYALELSLDSNIEDLGYPIAYTRITDKNVTLIIYQGDRPKIDEVGILYLVLTKLGGDSSYDIALTIRP